MARLTTQLNEALEEKTAISAMLRLVSTSSSNLRTVLESVAERAARICQAQFVDIFLVENNELHNAASFGETNRTLVFPLDRSSVAGRSICDLRPISIADLQNAGPDLARGREIARRDGLRSIIGVPLIRDGRALGTIIVRRTEVRPFEQKHIDLLTTFAAQAVIAIENARLLNELRESLQQQTATSDVLKVISSSPGDLRPVFAAMLENAVRICDAAFGSTLLREANGFRRVAQYNAPPDYEKNCQVQPFLRPTKTLTQILETMQPAQIADMAVAEPQSAISRLGRARTLLNVPMIKENELTGIFAIFRQEVRPFSDKQVELVKSFAAQAVRRRLVSVGRYALRGVSHPQELFTLNTVA